MALSEEKKYTIDDIYNLPEGTRAELIHGEIYLQASPSKTHQRLSGDLYYVIKSYIKSEGGDCEVYPAPFDIFLSGNESECFIPDISVICNPEIIKEKGCYGPPDWIIEITSPSTANRDYLLKLHKYQNSGVKEYWIVDPKTQLVTVYFFENAEPMHAYTFQDKIKVNIYDDLTIDFNQFHI